VDLGGGKSEERHANESFNGQVLEGEELGAGHIVCNLYGVLVVVCGVLKGGLKCVWYGVLVCVWEVKSFVE
jgi:hypothetical protein